MRTNELIIRSAPEIMQMCCETFQREAFELMRVTKHNKLRMQILGNPAGNGHTFTADINYCPYCGASIKIR